MVSLLEKAFSEAAKLSIEEQDALATWILEEIASDHRWNEQFANSQSQLHKLASEALDEFKAGRAELTSPD